MRVCIALLVLLSGCGAAIDDDDDPGAQSGLTLPEPGCAAARQSAAKLEFMNDACQRKRWPTDRDRSLACRTLTSTIPAGYQRGGELPQIAVDTTRFADLPTTIDLTVIHVLRDAQGKPYYRYYSNGTHQRAFETYSSSKFIAIANAATWLREASRGTVGLPARVGEISLGDLATVVHNYNGEHFTSSSLAGWFQSLGDPRRADALVHDWLGRGGDESFGGRYGDAPPSLGQAAVMDDGARVSLALHAFSGIANHLSTLTMAEALRRLVLHREEPMTRMPALTWDDVAVLLHGASTPTWARLPSESGVVAPLDGGGMGADSAIYLQSAIDVDAVERASLGRWRIYGKLGRGGEGLVENSYGCFPVLDADGAPFSDRGLELVISSHVATPNGASASHNDALVAAVYKEIVARLSR